MHSRAQARRGFSILLIAGLAMVGVAAPAHATPTDDLLDRAAQLQRELMVNGANIEILAEQYNGASTRRDFARAQIDAGNTALADLRGKRSQLGAELRRHVVVWYQSSGTANPLAALDSGSHRDARRRHAYSGVVGARDEELVDRYRNVESQLAKRAQHLDEYRHKVDAETVLLGMAKSRAETLIAKQRALLATARGELGAVLRVRRAIEDPDATALEARLELLGVGALPAAPSPKAALAVSYAIAQLGKPYVFAASGPDTFDCSGLTMMAWRQAGVSMAHFAATQFEQFPRVSVDALEPGDLVFFYPTVHHVGIYIGGGKMINAPHTGDVVRVASINRGNLVGAVRPG